MKKDNNGFTLVEIIVAMLVMTIVFGGVFVAFMSINKVNVVSRVSQSQTSIATALLESFYDTKYKDISQDTQFTIPTVYTWDSENKTYKEEGGIKTIKLENINGVASTYMADIVVTPFSADTDTQIFNGFSSFNTLGDKGTITVNTNKLASAEKTYDDLAIEEFKSRSDQYINSVNDANPDATPLDYISEEYISKNLDLVIGLDIHGFEGNPKKCTADIGLIYQLKSSVASSIVGTEADKQKIINIIFSSNVDNLSNIIIYTGDRHNVNSVLLGVNNGFNVYDAMEFNLYIVKTNELLNDTDSITSFDIDTYDYDGNKTLGSSLDIKQVDPDNTLLSLFTNVEKVQQNASLTNKKLQIYGLTELQNRMYNVDIIIKENATNTFEHLNETVLVLDYD